MAWEPGAGADKAPLQAALGLMVFLGIVLFFTLLFSGQMC